MPDACDRHRRGRGNRLACSHELASASSLMCPSDPLASMLARGHLGTSFCAACCNGSCSTLQSSPQRAAISPTAYRNLLRSIQQSSTQRTAIFTQRTAILHIVYCNSSHSIPQFSTQRTAILHIAYRNSSHSVLQSSPQHTAISSATYRNLRLQPSDGHPKPSDGHPKASDVHPKAANGDFSYYPDTFL